VELSDVLLGCAAGIIGVAMIPRVARVMVVAGPIAAIGVGTGATGLVVRYTKLGLGKSVMLVSVFPLTGLLYLIHRNREADFVQSAQKEAINLAGSHFGKKISVSSQLQHPISGNDSLRCELLVTGVPHRGRPRRALVLLEATRQHPFAEWQVQSVSVRLESNNMIVWELEDVPAHKLLLEAQCE